MRRLVCLAALAGVAFAGGGSAAAAPCSTVGPGGGALPNPVYLQIGDTQEPLIKSLGARLANETQPITFVYVTSGSCSNIAAIRANTPLAASATVKYIPSGFDPSTAPPTCTLDAAAPLDIANSALFNSACTTDAPPAQVIEKRGPNQAYVFAVPEASTQMSISAEEAYCAFGFGDNSNIDPWNDHTQMFIRTVTKSTLLALAAAIGVPAVKWMGVAFGASDQVVAALQSTTTPEKAIGILGAEVYDRNRATLNSLAFKAYGQWYAYYPDSTSTALDKQNVRDGHYFPWSPTIWMTRTDAPHYLVADYVINLILGVERPVDFDPLTNEIQVGLVPECAMKVTRSYEGGPLSPYQSPDQCGCFYDSTISGTDACARCDDANPCAGTQVCRHGYCEAQ